MYKDMAIADIKIGSRFRQNVGDLESLKASIKEHGLLNPITVDVEGRLLAGYRRLRATEELGDAVIEVNQINTLGDAVREIEVERDENTCRLEMTKSELASMAAVLADIEGVRARERVTANLPQFSHQRGTSATLATTSENSEQTGRVRELVGQALKVGSRTAGDLIIVGKAARSEDPVEREAAEEALREMDESETVRAPVDRFREKTGRKLEPRSAPPPQRNRTSPKNGREYPRKTDMVRPKDQEEILEMLAGQTRGLGDMITDIMGRISGEVHPDVNKAKIDQLLGDLRFARTTMTRMIKVLEGNNT